ncbi:MAG: signal peptidase II [Chitinispirillales bacterium]|nr:signal peptidase II [Chitinispirillales bacterium]
MEQKSDFRKIILFVVLTIIFAAFDFASKQAVVTTMQVGDYFPIFGNTFGLYLVYNKGAIFSFDPSKYIPFIKNAHFFLFVTFIALGFLSYYIVKLDYRKQKLLFWGIIFICAGAIGNGIDRIIRPESAVVDFFMADLGFRLGPIPFDPWPIFNFADIFVNIGLGLFILDYFVSAKKREKPDCPKK